MTEGLLYDDARVLRQAGFGQSFDHHPEQRRWDLEVEDRAVRVLDQPREPLVGGGVAEVAGQEGKSPGEALEHGLVDRLAARFDRAARALAQILDRPVIAGDAHDRAVEQAAALEPVERMERHHLRKVAGDAEHDEHVGVASPARAIPSFCDWLLGFERCAHSSVPSSTRSPAGRCTDGRVVRDDWHHPNVTIWCGGLDRAR